MAASLYEEVREAVGQLFAAGADDALQQFGLADLLASGDRVERSAAFAVAEAQGRTGASTPVVSRIALAGLELSESSAYGLRLAGASPGSAALYGLLGTHDPAEVLVADGTGDSSWMQWRPSAAFPSSLDPDYLTVYEVASDVPRRAANAETRDVEGRARLACAAEILGACETMLEDAINYTNTRHQFGSSLSGFQAVAHSLAWAATEVLQLRALLAVSIGADAVREPDRVLAAATKSMAGSVCRRVAQITMQVTGGMGFTWEYSHNKLHRRVLALDAVAGSAEALNREMGRWLRAGTDIDQDYPALISLPTLAASGLEGTVARRQ
jgi:Acyl-CoA dehydrogenase, C-terminal domain